MADFDEGLAIGLVLGRRKKSSAPEVYDDIFHDIIKNTRYLAEFAIGESEYSFRYGVWRSDTWEWGHPEIAEQYFNYTLGTDSMGEHAAICQLWKYSTQSSGTFRTVTVVFKNGFPLYANVETGYVNVCEDYNVYSIAAEKDSEGWPTKERCVFYKSIGNIKITDISASGQSGCSPIFSGITDSTTGEKVYFWSGQFIGAPGIKISFSYDSYDAYSAGEGQNPKIEKTGTYSSDRTMSGGYYDIVPNNRVLGTFSDMADATELIGEFQSVTHAVFDAYGIPYAPPVVI